MPGRIVRKSTYVRELSRTDKADRNSFCPGCCVEGRDSSQRRLSVGYCLRFALRTFWTYGQPDPTIIQTAPKPDFAFLWIYAVLAYLPPSLETPVMFIAPLLAIERCCFCRWWRGKGEALVAPSGCGSDACSDCVTLGTFTRLARIRRGVRSWMRGRAIRFRRHTCTVAHRWRGRARSFCRTSNAGTAIRSVEPEGFAADA